MKTDVVCLYHAGCLDGFASAFIVFDEFPNATFIPVYYGQEPPNVTGKEVFIVDFSYPPEQMYKITEQAHYVTVIDHHESAIRKLKNFSAENYTAKFDLTLSGTELTFAYFHGYESRIPTILRAIGRRDMWDFSNPDTKAIATAMFEEERSFEHWAKLLRDKNAVCRLTAVGKTLLKHAESNIERILKAGTRYVAGIPICNVPSQYSSDAGMLLSKGHAFAITYYDRSDCRQYSLRVSEGDFNVAEFAEKYGGGGHKKAAGFTLNLEEAYNFEYEFENK